MIKANFIFLLLQCQKFMELNGNGLFICISTRSTYHWQEYGEACSAIETLYLGYISQQVGRLGVMSTSSNARYYVLNVDGAREDQRGRNGRMHGIRNQESIYSRENQKWHIIGGTAYVCIRDVPGTLGQVVIYFGLVGQHAEIFNRHFHSLCFCKTASLGCNCEKQNQISIVFFFFFFLK